MKILPNAISRILLGEVLRETRLGMPSRDAAEFSRRLNRLAAMTGGKGFYQYPKGPKLSKGGLTRKERIKEGTFRRPFITVRP